MPVKVGVVFPLFHWGGAEAVLVWMVEALKRQYRVSVITLDPPDLTQINRFYGTELHHDDVEWRCLTESRLLGPSVFFARRSFSFRQSLIARCVRAMANDFDVLVSAFNEMDMGRPGVQYIHFPLFRSDAVELRRQLGYPSSTAHRLARRLLQHSMGWSMSRVRANRTLANSHWTARAVRDAYQIDAEVVYPPVWSHFPQRVWGAREDGFVLLSRGVREKRIERAVRILEAVRNRGPAVHLHIVGDIPDDGVGAFLHDAQRRHGDWLYLEGRLSRDALSQLLASHKYGIHARDFEQFGIAVAEMVSADCIPFVPSSGGQVEIVESHPSITFDSDDDAAEKICALMNDNALQLRVRNHLRHCAERFSASRFCEVFRSVVADELGRRGH